MNIHPKYLVIAAMVAVTVLIVVMSVLHERRRRRRLATTLAQLGAAFEPKPSPSAKDEAFRHVGTLRTLKTGGKGVQWCGEVAADGFKVRVLEHKYTTGSGKNQQTHWHTIASLPCPSDWPVLTLDEEHLFHKVADLLGKKDLQLDDPAFNARWRVKTDDENFAIVFLTPAVQAFLMALPKGSRLRVGEGAVCVLRKKRVPPEEIHAFVRAPAELWPLLPAELTATS